MCGIAGLLDRSPDAPHVLERMLTRLAHRGPDDSGIWHDPSTGIALGQRRLSIIDLSQAGHQPMASSSGRFVLTYNGEVYNHAELRHELERAFPELVWRGTSDTEILLAGIERWGVEHALQCVNGMFAFALWDRLERTLTLARDRMGEKPLYFGWTRNCFALASELKALTALPDWQPRMHAEAVSGFLRTGYVHGEASAVAGIFRLPPGSALELSLEDMCHPRDWPWLQSRIRRYWSLAEAATAGMAAPINDEFDAIHQLESLLRDAVGLRMAADVPLGAFLSGGIDSSLVTALMQSQSQQPVRTFSIGFHSPDHDEAPFARAVAEHLGTEHTELYADTKTALDLIPSLAEQFDEPFADTSQIPTLLVSALARRHVSVALSGDGGDELFGGYTRYFAITRLWRAMQPLPMVFRRNVAVACKLSAMALRPLPGGRNPSGPISFRLARLADRLGTTDLDAMRLSFIGGAGLARIMRDAGRQPPTTLPPPAIVEPLRQLMYADQLDYLPDDILFKVDRASMAHGLETRVPLLDHRIVELSWRFPSPAITQHATGKLPLRQLLDKHVPRQLIDRPKQGFAPPMDAWLRGPLREWAEVRLSDSSLRELPMLDAGEVRKLWLAHCNGRMNAGYALWNVLMLADWRERFGVIC
ncbi:MAG: asparagine synthase (glutamine-hydrolyzing) [Proteobacteria bacterium]|nr:asparagine synthase (glutamine-hydrolyzing) [Pseudomonadota bacterium]